MKNKFKSVLAFALGLISLSATAQVTPVASGEFFGTYQQQNAPLYVLDGNKPGETLSGASINIYVVTCGNTILGKTKINDGKLFWGNTGEDGVSVRVWNAEQTSYTACYQNGKSAPSGDCEWRYTADVDMANTKLSGKPDEFPATIRANSWISGNAGHSSAFFNYKRNYINNPSTDAVAPVLNTANTTFVDNQDGTMTVAFGAVTADDEYFYYVVDTENEIAVISLKDTIKMNRPDPKNGTSYSFVAYAVDFNGNKSAGKTYAYTSEFDVQTKYDYWQWNTTANEGWPIRMTWVTMDNGDIRINILPNGDEGAGVTEFRNGGMALNNFKVNGNAASTYFKDPVVKGAVLTLELINHSNKPAQASVISYDGYVEYKTGTHTNAYPTLKLSDYIYETKVTVFKPVYASLSANTSLAKTNTSVTLIPTALNQMGDTMQATVTYTTNPANAGTFNGNTFIPKKTGTIAVTAHATAADVTANSAPFNIFAYKSDNVAIGAEATAYEGTVGDPYNVIDGNTTGAVWEFTNVHDHKWVVSEGVEDATYPSWIQIDLGVAHKMEVFGIYFDGACSHGYKVQYSADGQNFTDAYTYDRNCDFNHSHTDMLYPGVVKAGVTDHQADATNVRYVRVVNTMMGNWGARVREIEIYALPPVDHTSAAAGAAAWENMTTDDSENMYKSSNGYLVTKTPAGKHGTICLPYDATVEGAAIYAFTQRVAEGLEFDYAEETAENSVHVLAGQAYIYFATDDTQYWNLDDSEDPVAVATGNLLEGSYAEIPLENGEYFLYTEDEYFHPAGENVVLPTFRACIPVDNMPAYVPGAPVRIIVPHVATGVENVVDYKAVKAIVDGKIVIFRGDKCYNVAGAILK